MTAAVLLLSAIGCVFVTPEERRVQRCAASDIDRDGVCDVDDCAPDDPTRAPGAQERCNGVDDDCDDIVDEDLFADRDGDGWGVADDGACSVSWVTRAGDCDDDAATTHPGAADRCDGMQNDCDVAWAPEDEVGLVTHVDPAGVVTDLTPDPTGGVADLDLPASGTVYICAGATDALDATLRVGAVEASGLAIVGVPVGTDPATVHARHSRTVLRVEPDAVGVVTVRALAFTGGQRGDGGKGGGIWSGTGTELVLERVVVKGNTGVFGGVWSQGHLEMYDSEVTSNSTEDLSDLDEPTFYGGGLTTNGTAYVLDSRITGNYSSSWGGGVFTTGAIVLNGTTVSGNTTDGDGAGIYAAETVRLVGAHVVDNRTKTPPYAGGGIFVAASGEVFCSEGSELARNTGSDGAGVTVASGAYVSGVDCQVSGNTLHDGTPADLRSDGETWTPPEGACFQCDGRAPAPCEEIACP